VPSRRTTSRKPLQPFFRLTTVGTRTFPLQFPAITSGTSERRTHLQLHRLPSVHGHKQHISVQLFISDALITFRGTRNSLLFLATSQTSRMMTTTSAGLTDKRTKPALRACKLQGGTKQNRSKINQVIIHFKEYKFKQRSTKKCTSALLKCSTNKSSGPWAVDYIQ